jgi:Flp pilus assembly protein TadB
MLKEDMMLSGQERDSLRKMEQQIATADPGFAATLRKGQTDISRRGAASTPRHGRLLAILAVLSVVLLVLGLPAAAVIVAALVAALGWVRWGVGEGERR